MRNFYSRYIKNDIGVFLCIFFYIVFCIISIQLKPYLDGADWYYASSVQRFLFGIIELLIFVKLFDKGSWKNVINFTSVKEGILSGNALIIYIILFAITIAIGCKSFIDTTFSLTFSCLFLQQITTGFWEELTFRAFLNEGYWKRKNQNWSWRLFYATLSFMIFGMIHAIEYTSNIGDAIDVFISTGVMGFTFAAIYLYSHNILVPMLLHFAYDIFANMQSFIKEWNIDNTLFLIFNNYILVIAFIVMFVSAVFFVIKEPNYQEKM